MKKGDRIKLRFDYRTGKGGVFVPKGSDGVVRHVDMNGNVAVTFDEPFQVGNGYATGLTFSPKQAEVLVEPIIATLVA